VPPNGVPRLLRRLRPLLAIAVFAGAAGVLAAWILRPAPSGFVAVRLIDGPILDGRTPGLEGSLGENVNGPSLLRVPGWVSPRLGRYYLYFAHHRGRFIRLAYADRLTGPWRVLPGGVLRLEETAAHDHVASPDVHADEGRREIRLYFHGPLSPDRRQQATFLATSRDGLHFQASRRPLGPPYARVFRYGGQFYAGAKESDTTGVLLRSPDGLAPFEPGPEILPHMRHAAVLLAGEAAWIFFSRIGDAPERLLAARMPLSGDWRQWRPGPPAELLAPERPWEGASLAAAPSVPGGAWEAKRQLRDPAVYVEGGRTYLFYAAAGERSIALAELRQARSR